MPSSKSRRGVLAALRSEIKRYWRRLQKPEAQTILRRLAVADNGKRIIYTEHVEQRQRERGIRRRQIINCLKKGTVTTQPKFDSNQRSWKFKVEKDHEDYSITCVVAVQENATAIVITAWINDDEDDEV